MAPFKNRIAAETASFVVWVFASCLPFTSHGESPEVHDKRFAITLYAKDPAIVTPIGMAIDGQDRLFVIESHTHHPPKDYEGPPHDRIKIFVDENDDGHADHQSVFAEGLHQALNLAFSPSGVLHAVCAREVVALPDRNRDDVCDGLEPVLTLETEERYAHNSLLGITFDPEGWLYVGRGNTGSHAYRLRGRDGTEVSGYGDGGNVIRCRPDGTRLTEVATGFWNPFNLKFDMNGRLLLVDNDPDARGPNRLLQVISGGDYGYKSLYGGGGNHPFQGWDGSLPGTLPYIAGTGEAPCDLIDCRRTAFPVDYGSSVLATIWNENSIERYQLRPEGAMVTLAEKSLFLSGGKNFRPVGLEADSRGRLFVTDWVLVDYPNHGRGRIWRIDAANASELQTPRGYFDHPGMVHVTVDEPLLRVLSRGSPFVRHEAIRELARPEGRSLRRQALTNADPNIRLAGVLASRAAGEDENLGSALKDPDPEVRRAALVWAGESLDKKWLPMLDAALSGEVSVPLFEAYLAAVENLGGSFAEDYRARRTARANRLTHHLDISVLTGIARDPAMSSAVRALALRRLKPPDVVKARAWIEPLLESAEEPLLLAAIVQMGKLSDRRATEALLHLALSDDAEVSARCEALLALSSHVVAEPKRLLRLVDAENIDVALEAVRTLRFHAATPEIRSVLEQRLERAEGELAEQLAFALFHNDPERNPHSRSRPVTVDGWKQVLAEGGDPRRGRRVFFTVQLMCSRCHSVDGEATLLGPSLVGIARSFDRSQIIHSIVRPSDSFPPQYQAWIVHTVDGASHPGLQLDHKSGGAIELLGLDGVVQRFEKEEIRDYEVSPDSLMPPNLDALMPIADFRNLVAFLESLKG